MSFQTRRLSGETPPDRSPLSSAVPVALRTSRGIWGWYKSWKARRQAEERERTFLRRALIGIFAVFLVFIVLAGTVKALIAMQILTPSKILNLAGTDLPADADGFTNVLLLGSGDKDHDGVDLTDSMMLASIDPHKTKSVVLLSLPRDLYAVRTQKMGRGRINSLYRDYKWYLKGQGMSIEAASMEALKELSRELGRQLGVEIHHVVKIDFTAFVETVDSLGGLDITVPEDLVDPEYPGPNYSYETFSISAGLQHMDGETALKYARSRHTTSDFSRSERQQQLLKALGDKAKTEGVATSPGKISALFKILSEHVETTMNFGEILGLGKLADKIDRQNVISMNLNNSIGGTQLMPSPGGFLYSPPREAYNGAAVLLPMPAGTEREGSWRQLRAFTYLLLHSRSIYLAQPQIYILNAGAKSGLARMLGAELARYGFPVSEIGNLSDDVRDETQKRETSTVIAKVDLDQSVAEFLASLLQITTSPVPTDILPDKLGQLTIILGKDYTYSPMQDLVPSEESTTASGTTLSSAMTIDDAMNANLLPGEAPDSPVSSDSPAHRSLGEGGSDSSESSL